MKNKPFLKLEKLAYEESPNDSPLSIPREDLQTLLSDYKEMQAELFALRKNKEESEQAIESQESINEEMQTYSERLHDSEQKYKEAAAVLDTIFDTIPDVLGIQDDKHNILRYNKAGYEFPEVTPESIRGKKCYEIIGRKSMCEKCATEEAYLTLKPAKVERYFPEIDTWLDIRAYPVLDEEKKVQYIIEHLRDITKTKKYEEQLKEARIRAEESDQLKSAFLANMSHEIRTPLNAILGFAELMEANLMTEEKKAHFIGYILDSGKQLLGLINDLIDISKIESGQLRVDKSHESLLNHINEVKAIFANHKILTQKPQLNLHFRQTEVSPAPMIYTDPIRLKQILINLIQNALKFTEKGVVEVGWEKQERNYMFYVQDSGIGIPQDLQSKVFDRFTKLKGNDEDGTGLGLSISKGLVELLGGKILLESRPGEGSRFSFTIPLEDVPKNISIKENREALASFPDLQNKMVYIAEDDSISYQFLLEVLQYTGAEVRYARNGKELMELINLHEPDLVLLDINMPEMDGLEASRQIRKKGLHMPVIAQTAYALEVDREECIKAGCSDYITKPYTMNQIRKLIQRNM